MCTQTSTHCNERPKCPSVRLACCLILVQSIGSQKFWFSCSMHHAFSLLFEACFSRYNHQVCAEAIIVLTSVISREMFACTSVAAYPEKDKQTDVCQSPNCIQQADHNGPYHYGMRHTYGISAAMKRLPHLCFVVTASHNGIFHSIFHGFVLSRVTTQCGRGDSLCHSAPHAR